MDIRDLQYVLELAKKKSFTKSAEAFYISQSALSQKIANLEKELGLKLFNRSNRTITLTDAGLTFFSHAKEVVDAWDQLQTAMSLYKTDIPNQISVGLFTQANYTTIPSMIMNFISTHQDYNINISISSEMSLLSGLSDNTCHIAFLRCNSNDIPSDIHKIPLQEEPLGILIHKNDPLAKKSCFVREDVVNYQLICEKFGLTNSYESLAKGFALRNLDLPKPFAYTDNAIMLAELISAPGHFTFTTHESGLKMQEVFPHLHYLQQIPYQPITLFLLYAENNQKIAAHPFCKYIKKQFQSGNK